MLGTIERRGAHPLLKVREAGTSSLKGHDLAVNDEIGDALMLKWLDQLWIRRVLVGAVSRQQRNPVPFSKREATDAIQFSLEDPIRIREPFVCQDREHRTHPSWLRPPPQPAPSIGG
jgi:hypothetical protein